MTVNIVTKDDLQNFKTELLADLTKLLEAKTEKPKKWLKSYEVRELLGISRGTLQHLRITESLTYSKVGGLMYYKYEDILEMMERDKHIAPKTLPKRFM